MKIQRPAGNFFSKLLDKQEFSHQLPITNQSVQEHASIIAYIKTNSILKKIQRLALGSSTINQLPGSNSVPTKGLDRFLSETCGTLSWQQRRQLVQAISQGEDLIDPGRLKLLFGNTKILQKEIHKSLRKKVGEDDWSSFQSCLLSAEKKQVRIRELHVGLTRRAQGERGFRGHELLKMKKFRVRNNSVISRV